MNWLGPDIKILTLRDYNVIQVDGEDWYLESVISKCPNLEKLSVEDVNAFEKVTKLPASLVEF
jgi:hypothetical protein